MDIPVALFCGGVAAISAVVIYVISVHSMREKTYEEAIAEQRKMPEENLLLGRSVKDKAKDKKQKKVGKKVKEKSADHEKNDHNDLPSKHSPVLSTKVHVDFEEPEAEVVSERLPQDDKKKKKKEKVKSILLNRDEPSLIENSPPVTPSNHFEEILPKDDLLLKRKESREEVVSKSSPPHVPAHENVKQSNPTTKSTVKVDASNKSEEEKASSSKVESVSGSKIERVQNANKETEKKKDSAKQDKAPSKPEKLSPKSEKISPKSDKVSSKPEKAVPKSETSPKPEKNAADKIEKVVVKSEKPVVNKTEKSAPVKAEKASVKTEKPIVEKVEKVTSAKTEKPANAKPEKSSTKPDSSTPPKNDKTAKQEKKVVEDAASPSAPEVKVVAPAPVSAAVVKQEAPVSNTVPPKEKSRKKKSELAALQQMSGERDGVNMSLLLPIVQKADLSRSEIQILIDHLLNKQNAGVSDAEWIEGRQDPVVKLKKQLAEKEKALAEEQEALKGVQAKLKELRQELNSERSRLTHSCRQLEETLVAKTNEAQNLTVRLQHTQETVNNEKQSLTLQVQQLQQKLNEEHVRLCQLQDQERQVQEEIVGQRQQLEMHIGRLTEQEKALKAQVVQLMSQVKEHESVNASLNLELQGFRDSQMSETNLLHERAAHAEKQLLVYKENVERAQELTQQLEDLRNIRSELEHRLSAGQQREATLQYEVNNVRKEMEDVKAQLAGYEALKNDCNRLRSENDKLTNQLHQFKDLHLENQRLHEDNERLSSQLVELPLLQKEASQLREENENLAAQVTAMTERPAAEGRENGDIQFHEEKRELPKGDFTLFEKTIQQKEGQVMQLSAELEEKSSLVKQMQSEINTYKTDISELNSELEEQKRKNNDLRKKNWKAMDALSAMEKSLQSKVQNSSPDLVSEISQKIYSEQQNATKLLLQRIFPEIKIEDCKNYERWLEQFESLAAKSLSELKLRPSAVIPSTPVDEEIDVEDLEKQNAHLQGLVSNYKTIIGNTEGMLKQLQNKVEEGEIRWRQQLQVKEAELEAVRQELSTSTRVPSAESGANNPATQCKVEDLQAKLKIHDQEKQDLEARFTSLTRNVEQLKEERNGLSVELKKEQEKSQELSKELVRLRSLVQIGKDSLNQEHEMVVNLQQQVDKLNGVHQNHNASSNGPSTESSVAQSLPATLRMSESTSSEKGMKSKKKKGGSGKK